MAIRTDALFASTQHRVSGMFYRMVSVAGFALRQSHFVKSLFVGTFKEKLAVIQMALAADKGD